MRRSQSFIKTRKQVPADEQAHNAQLLIRAGYIHKEMAGVYSYLPLGKKTLDNIANIVRDEMNAAGGEELQMSVLQPKELWERTDRWDDNVVDNWFKTKLKNGAELGIGLTHEEPIAEALSDYIPSYKDLPAYVYQIQNKYRNELRAKSGLLRGREFVMKDLYSLSRNQEEHEEFYDKMTTAYMKVYARIGLGEVTYPTYASGGYFSEFSREFQTLSQIGEDTIYLDKEKGFAINKEIYDFKSLEKLGTSKERLTECKAVEVGNIFPLGTKFTDALGIYYADKEGKQQSIIMGSYGIGISRLMGLLAEHFADERGLVWPASVAPYQVYLANLGDNREVSQAAEDTYKALTDAGIRVIFDDRDTRPGEKFADADLMGMPLRLVISDKSLQAGGFELKSRSKEDTQIVAAASAVQVTVDRLKSLV
ncbi:MAG TPA: aminoacyl--tRNA ligase-related protein [Candidatus Binatia bacterium]|nr:aminoacyl--tRNA ligase-related protein [Candidatus Binatia bacterium]